MGYNLRIVRRRLNIAIAVVSALLSVAGASAPTSSTSQAALAEITDEKYGFVVHFPQNWQKTSATPGMLGLSPPGEKKDDVYLNAIAYPITDLPGNVKSLQAVHQRDLELAKAAHGTILEDSDITLGAIPAKLVRFSVPFDLEKHIISICGLKDGIVYGISFTAPTDAKLREYEPVVRTIAREFETKPPATQPTQRP